MNHSPFSSTRWSAIRRAASTDQEVRTGGWGELFGSYWPPLYAFLRRKGRAPEEAADLIQGLFASLMDSGGLGAVEPQGARFRSWLLASLVHHERDVRAKAEAQKRGGAARVFSLDTGSAESRYGPAVIGGESPEAAYDRAWALQVLAHAREALMEECVAKGQGDLFRCLEMTLDGDCDREERELLARRLNRTPVAIRVAIHRLRARYAALVRLQVQDTLDGSDELEEFEALRLALAGEILLGMS